MSDLETLRKALDIMERAQRSGLKADEWATFKTARVLQAAARRFLALTETGQRVEWCEVHRHEGFDSEHEPGWVCESGEWIEDKGRWDCRMVSVYLIPTDHLTEEETK